MDTLPETTADPFTFTLRSHIRRAHRTFVTPDNKFLISAGTSGVIEYRSLEQVFAKWASYGNPVAKSTEMAVSPNGRQLAFGQQEGKVTFLEAEGLGDSPLVSLMRVTTSLLLEKRYDELESLAQEMAKEKQPFGWAGHPMPLLTYVSILTTPNGVNRSMPQRKVELDNWLEARPQSQVARLIQAQTLIQTAWAARGMGPAGTVKPEAWKVFNVGIAQARDILIPLCKEPNVIPEAYAKLLIVAKAESWDQEKVQPYEDILLRQHSYYVGAHKSVLERYMPRWGGAPTDCRDYMTRVADKIGGPEGDVMYARLATTFRSIYFYDEFNRETQCDVARLKRGLLLWAKTAPDANVAKHYGLWFALINRDQAAGAEFLSLFRNDEELFDWEGKGWQSDEELLMCVAFAQGKLQP
jgi:hypothetical protein